MSKPTPAVVEAWAGLVRTEWALLDKVEEALKRARLPPLDWYHVLHEIDRAPKGMLRQTGAFRAREEVTMPPPGSTAAARLTVRLSDVLWDTLYAPIGVFVERIASFVNPLQFLSIRHYLSFVFAALVGLLFVLALWP